ncbi:hypothetical protein NUSPORA_02377 [Nucleospora cyclopteri]
MKKKKKHEKNIQLGIKDNLIQNPLTTKNISFDEDSNIECTFLSNNTNDQKDEILNCKDCSNEKADRIFLEDEIEENEDDNFSFSTNSSTCDKNINYCLYRKIFIHQDADSVPMHITELNFLKKDFNNLPPNFSFFPGWFKHKIPTRILNNLKFKRLISVEICKNYGLIKFYFLIYIMIQKNTYPKEIKKISLDVIFHLVCYHLCKTYNLGKGTSVEVDKKYSCHHLIKEENFFNLFKPKDYWLKNAESLLQKTKKRAKTEYGITQSSLKAIHLYNVLPLLSHKNVNKVALVYFIFYATQDKDINPTINSIDEEEREKIAKKKKKLFKINNLFRKYRNTAFKAYKKLISIE